MQVRELNYTFRGLGSFLLLLFLPLVVVVAIFIAAIFPIPSDATWDEDFVVVVGANINTK